MDKRALRKAAVPNRKLNLNSGIFRAEQIKYVVCTAIKNIAHRRTLVLYVYDRQIVSTEDLIPRWTVFQTKDAYITLARTEKGYKWQTGKMRHITDGLYHSRQCAFYSRADEERVMRFFQKSEKTGFDRLDEAQDAIASTLLHKKQAARDRKIAARMSMLKPLPRDLRGFIHRETLPHYIFFYSSENQERTVEWILHFMSS